MLKIAATSLYHQLLQCKKIDGEKYIAVVTQYKNTVYGKTTNGKTKNHKNSHKGCLENQLYVLKVIIKKLRQLFCTNLLKWSKFLSFGDRLSEKNSQVGKHLHAARLRQSYKWNKLPDKAKHFQEKFLKKNKIACSACLSSFVCLSWKFSFINQSKRHPYREQFLNIADIA